VNPVCRFYIPPVHGNSHFFSASPAECNLVVLKTATDPNFSGYVYESPNVFYATLPDTTTGACPAGTAPVFRLWNQRIDSNHRYTASAAIKAQMIATGYVAEGYGPNAVIMCAASAGTGKVVFVAGTGAPSGALVSDGASTLAANFSFVATTALTSGRVPAPGGHHLQLADVVGNRARQPDRQRAVANALARLSPWVVAGPYRPRSRRRLLASGQCRRAARRAITGDRRRHWRARRHYAAFVQPATRTTSIAADIGARPGHQHLPGQSGRRFHVARYAGANGGGFVAIRPGAGAPGANWDTFALTTSMT
jgi:hypothetical protein